MKKYKEGSIINIVDFVQLNLDQINVFVGGMAKSFSSESPLART